MVRVRHSWKLRICSLSICFRLSLFRERLHSLRSQQSTIALIYLYLTQQNTPFGEHPNRLMVKIDESNTEFLC